jgi:lactam utilization protein B
MKKALLLLAISGSALLGGCASSDPELSQSVSSDDKHYVLTGTRIPRRDPGGVKTIDKDEMERAAQQMGTNNGAK